MSFVHWRWKWRCLIIIHNVMFGENQTQHISTNASYQLSSTVVEGWWFGLALQPQDPQSLSWPGTHLFSKVFKSEAICLKAKAWLKLGHTTGQWSQTQQQIYNRMAEKEKNQSVAMLWWERAVHGRMPEDLNEQKQCCKKGWNIILPK